MGPASVQQGWLWGKQGNPLHHCLPGQQFLSFWGQSWHGGPTFRVKPVALLVNLSIHPGARPRAELKGRLVLFLLRLAYFLPVILRAWSQWGGLQARQSQLQQQKEGNSTWTVPMCRKETEALKGGAMRTPARPGPASVPHGIPVLLTSHRVPG